MKKFLLSLVLLFPCATCVQAEQEQDQKLAVKFDRSTYTIQEPVTFSALTETSLYAVLNQKEDELGHRIARFARRLIGLSPKEVTLDHRKQANPLYGDTIDYMAVDREDNLYVVGHKDPATLYKFTSAHSTDNIAMLSAQGIHDAEGNPTSGIVGFAHGIVSAEGTQCAFLAVKKHEGRFGEPGSGIAVLRYDPDIKKEKEKKKNESSEKDEEEEKSKPFLDILDPNNGTSKGNRAYALDFSAAPLSINHGLEQVGEVVDMYWSGRLQRLYVAMHVKTKDDARDDQGACALLVGRMQDKKLIFEPIVPHVALQGDHSVLGATRANKSITLHKVRTMRLTNTLTYLIVVGGNGTSEETSQKIHAFPVVSTDFMVPEKKLQLINTQGTIAKKGCTPTIKTHSNNALEARSFEQAAQTSSDMFTSNDLSVQVGGSAQLPGPVHDIRTKGDCVVVTVLEDGNGQAGGVFYSQAIQNEHGVVQAWTEWQRVPGGNKKALQALPRIGEFRFLYQLGPEKNLQVKTTGWHTPQDIAENVSVTFDNIQACVEGQFSAGTLYGLTDYPAASSGISGNDRLSMLVALGMQKVLFMQTSECDSDGILRSVDVSYADIFRSDDGTFAGFSATQAIKDVQIRAASISGGALADCGALSCSAVGISNDSAWFFVGGSGGLAVLARQDGSGWNAQTGIGNNFGALTDDLAFKKIGDYRFIRKLVCCGDYLYVLTNTTLDRISLVPEQFSSSTKINIEHLISNVKGERGRRLFLNDMLINSDLVLLATSDGLYWAIPDKDITLQKVALPAEQQPVTSLSVASRTGLENDFAHKGHVYVLARSTNYRQTYIYRLFVDISRGAEDAVQVMHDCYKKDEIMHWIRYAAPQQGFITDGISLYSYCSRLNKQDPHVSLLPVLDLRSRSILKGIHIVQLPLKLENSHEVRAMVRNSATGSWLVAGDFGLRVNM